MSNPFSLPVHRLRYARPHSNSISTGNPEFRVSREAAFRHAADNMDPANPLSGVLERIYNNSRIDSRYFCVPDLVGSRRGGGSGSVGWGDGEGRGERGGSSPQAFFYPPDGR